MSRSWCVVGVLLLVAACAAPDRDSAQESPALPGAASPSRELDPETVRRVESEFAVVGQLLQQGRFDEALDTASAAIAIAPQRIEPYEVLSNWYTQLERHDLAIVAFERLAGGDLHGLRFLARHQALSNQRETAEETLERCLASAAEHPGCRLERALLRRARGGFAEAADDLRVAYAGDADPATAAHLVEMLRLTGDYEAVGTVLETALETSPNSADLLFARARLLLRDRDDAGAEPLLRRVIELEPGAAALRLLGGLLIRTGREAEGHFRLGQADLYRDYDTAIQTLKQGYAGNAHVTGALLIAEVELTIGNFDEALGWLEAARAAGASPQRIAAAEAWISYARGDAIRGDAALARAGGEGDGHANLARAARATRAREPEMAVVWLQRAVAAGPNERCFLHRAADLYRSIGHVAAAEELRLRTATAEFP